MLDPSNAVELVLNRRACKSFHELSFEKYLQRDGVGVQDAIRGSIDALAAAAGEGCQAGEQVQRHQRRRLCAAQQRLRPRHLAAAHRSTFT